MRTLSPRGAGPARRAPGARRGGTRLCAALGAVAGALIGAAGAGCDADDPDPNPVLLSTADAMPDAIADGSDAMPDVMADAMPDAMPDAGCDPDCPLIEWQDGPPLTRVSDHHTTFVLADETGASLYVLGGISTDPRGGILSITDEMNRAEIGADGMPAPFTLHQRLPFPIGFHAQAVAADRAWLFGGVRQGVGGPTPNRDVVTVRFGPGGRVEGAEVCPEPLPEATVHPTAALLDGRLHIIGGTRQAPIDAVWVADIGPDGCPVDFAPGPPLPAIRSHHATAVVDGRILVLGGFGQGQIPSPDILASTAGADGAIDGWQVVGALDPSPWTAAAVVQDDALWLIGGGEGFSLGARFVDTVRRAPLVDGVPGEFVPVAAALPIARSHVHQTPLHDGRIYSVGGRVFQDDGVSMTSVDRTFVGRLRAP